MKITLPACADCESGVETVTVVQRPVVDDLRVVLCRWNGMTVHVELGVGELHRDRVVMPVSIADLRQLPAELGRTEALQVAISKLATQQENQAAVADEQRKVMAVHLCFQSFSLYKL